MISNTGGGEELLQNISKSSIYMIKDVCLKWADDSREVQSVAGGITVQKQERRVSEPPLSEPQIYFSQNGCRRDFYQQRNMKREDLSLILSLKIRKCNISSKEGNWCNLQIINRSVQITSVSLLEVQSCFSQCNATGLNHYPL